jgi:putative Mn2+ efflux pump MntP
MTFDIEDVFVVVNPAMGASLFVVGIVFGFLFYRDRRSQRLYLFRSVLAGCVFVGTVLPVRLAQDAAQWESWIGVLGLWLVFVGGTAIGSTALRLSREDHDEPHP